MNEDTSRILKNSKDREELAAAALTLAASRRAADHQTLLEFLRSEYFLSRLDAPEDYRDLTRKLRLRRVLEALRDNFEAPTAHEILIELTAAEAMSKDELRIDILISMLAAVRPAPPRVVDFWDAHAQPDDGFTPLTIEALVENGDETALLLLEKKMLDERHDERDKIGWMRTHILSHRHDAELLRSCRRLLARDWDERLKIALVEALFDYQPEIWYLPHVVFRPPARRDASSAARKEFRLITDYALTRMALDGNLRKKVSEHEFRFDV